MAAEKRKRLLFAMMEFLQDCKDTVDGEEKKESLDVAIQCISDSFSIDLTDAAQQTLYSIKPLNLLSIFDVYLKTVASKQAPKPTPSVTKAQVGEAAVAPEAVPSSQKFRTADPIVTEPHEPSQEDRKRADLKKGEGNKRMAEKQYDEAIKLYTEAIELDPLNAVYYSNRAAAHSQKGDHESAIFDAQAAVKIDPNYSKAYSRLGLAHYSLGNYVDAVNAYEKGLELEPGNSNWRQQLQMSRDKLASVESPSSPGSPTAGSRTAPSGFGAGGTNPLAGLAGMPGLGGPGGLDLNSIMSNPMFQQMAQQLMSDPQAMQNLMSNPMVQNMLGGMGGARP